MDQTLPSGIVTLLLTDIERSVQHWERDPAAMPSAVELHEHVLATAVQACGGQLLKSKGEGDSTFSVFAVADAAVCAAFEAQRALSEIAWSTSEPIRVRMAIHSGKSLPRDGDYFGLVPIRTARLREVGHGDQVLASAAAEVLARRLLPPELQLTPLGRHRLRDLSEAEEVYQVDSRLAPQTFPPLKSTDAWPNNLPTLLASFIGRVPELEDVREDLSSNRLVTLLGPPGVGKTRLSLQVGAELLHEYPDGVWFIELAPLQDAATLAMALATALHVRPDDDPLRAVVAYAKSRRMLFIFDNCEHMLAPAASTIRAILSQCRTVSVLATSRGSLNLDVGQQLDVRPLSLPAEGVVGRAVESSDAVHLFTERAHASSGLTLTDDNADHVVRICRAIEGIPLALEMAAAWTRVLGVRQIAERVEKGQFTLEWIHPDPDAGYPSFDEAIRWSWDLLPESARSLCCQLAVFEGGAQMESLEAMTERPCLVDLATLVRQSLVQRTEDAAGHSRYRMHALVRDFAVRELRADGVERETRDRHARLFLEFAEQASEAMRGPSLAEWRPRLDDEQSNIQGAFRWFVEQGKGEEALRLSSALWFYNYMRGSFAEGRELVERALALRTPETPKDVEARALHAAGTLAAYVGDLKVATHHLESATTHWKALDDSAALANTLNNRGLVAYLENDFTESSRLYNDALALRRASEDQHRIVDILLNLAQNHVLLADLATARLFAVEALALTVATGNERQHGDAQLRLAMIDIDGGNYDQGERLLRDCLAMASCLNYPALAAGASCELGRLWLELGEFETAQEHLKDSLVRWRTLDNAAGMTSALRYLGEVALFKGTLRTSFRRYRQCKRIAPHVKSAWLVSAVDDGMGRLWVAQGRIDEGAQQIGSALEARIALNCPLPVIQSIESVVLVAATRHDASMARALYRRATTLRAQIVIPRPRALTHFLEQHLEFLSDTNRARFVVAPSDAVGPESIEEAVALARLII